MRKRYILTDIILVMLLTLFQSDVAHSSNLERSNQTWNASNESVNNNSFTLFSIRHDPLSIRYNTMPTWNDISLDSSRITPELKIWKTKKDVFTAEIAKLNAKYEYLLTVYRQDSNIIKSIYNTQQNFLYQINELVVKDVKLHEYVRYNLEMLDEVNVTQQAPKEPLKVEVKDQTLDEYCCRRLLFLQRHESVMQQLNELFQKLSVIDQNVEKIEEVICCQKKAFVALQRSFARKKRHTESLIRLPTLHTNSERKGKSCLSFSIVHKKSAE